MLHQRNGNALECAEFLEEIRYIQHYYTLLYRKRASLDDDARRNQRQEERIAHKQRRIGQSSTLFAASQAFISAVKEGPDYVCVCCNRLTYRKTVQ